MIGDRISEARAVVGLTQGELVESLEGERGAVGRQQLSNYETGKASPTADFVLLLCRTHDINPTWLLSGEGPVRWSAAREGGWWEGATFVSRRVVEVLRDSLSRESGRKLAALLDDGVDDGG